MTSRVSRTTRVVRKLSTGESLSTKHEEFRRDHATAVGGLDLEVAVAGRLAMVSQLRVRVYPVGAFDDSCCGPQFMTVEPRIGLRWRFN